MELNREKGAGHYYTVVSIYIYPHLCKFFQFYYLDTQCQYVLPFLAGGLSPRIIVSLVSKGVARGGGK